MRLAGLLLRIHENLLTLKERKAKFGGNVPLELLNQIEDHQTAIALIEEALATELAQSGVERLKENLRPLVVAANVESIDLDALKPEKPRLPFEPETVLVSAGPFLMGSRPGDHIPDEETPQHEVTLPEYRLGKYPVTNTQYAAFIKREPRQEVPKKAGWFLREPPANKLDHPVVGVSWHGARVYCKWLSGETDRSYRLPTEAEWEKAASWTGTDKSRYSWGNDFDEAKGNTKESGLGDTTAVGTYSPHGDSPFGCVDMVGNVQEWTSTLWGSNLNQNDFPYPYQANDGREDLAAEQRLYRAFRVYRGGSFRDNQTKVSTTARGASDPDSKIKWRGFRVVLEVR
jgi:formylglycine-generating enzyme required for sulfatase activity